MGNEISPAAVVIAAIVIIALLVIAGSLALPAFRMPPHRAPERDATGGSPVPAAVPAPGARTEPTPLSHAPTETD